MSINVSKTLGLGCSLLLVTVSACEQNSDKPTANDQIIRSLESAWVISGDAGVDDDAGGPVTTTPPPPKSDAGTPSGFPTLPPVGARLYGGFSVFTSAPGLVSALVAKGILPLPAAGAQVGGIANLADVQKATISMTLPVVFGNAHAEAPFSADVTHAGGLNFSDGAAFRSVVISGLEIVIDGSGASPTGYVAALIDGDLSKKVKVFDIDPASIKPDAQSPIAIRLQGLALTLTSDAATQLNSALSSDLFSAGQAIGSIDCALVSR
jgi:hypothetical protein